MRDAFIVDALRTPVGRHGGALAGVRPDDLAARVIGSVTARTGLDTGSVEDVVLGCTNGAGEDNRNVARMASLLAGLPVEVPGTTVNRLCASGLEAVAQAARGVRLGEAELVLAGGVESMSRSPFVMLKPERGFPRGNAELVDSTLGWRFVNPRLKELYSTESMGETAENVAERYGVTRADQDAFALESHLRAVAAAEAGRFDDELVTVEAPQPKGDPVTVHSDEGPRPDTSLERLGRLPAAFRAGGTVTAGNSSPLNDGAACLVLASEGRTAELGRQPLARIISSGVAGVDPAYMGIGPVPAARQALERAGLTVDDLDLVELNEAFAAQVLACTRELGIPLDKLNVNGGAIALGHPLGCSGARLLTTLCWELRRRGARYGMATMCVGVGMGMAMVVENAAGRHRPDLPPGRRVYRHRVPKRRRHGEGPRPQREGRQAVRRAAQEGNEQGAGGEDRQQPQEQPEKGREEEQLAGGYRRRMRFIRTRITRVRRTATGRLRRARR